jgi:putative ABC transport system permease protein
MLLRKMRRDIKLNLAQFISIFLMALLGVLVYAGINAEWYGMQTEAEKYYAETRLPDLWVMGDYFTPSDVEQVKALSGVSAVASRLTLDVVVNSEQDQTLRINLLEDTALSTPKLVAGKAFAPVEDGLWLDATFARANQLKVGDEISFSILGMEYKKEILGLIIHPEYVHNVKDETSFMPSPETFGFAFLTAAAFPAELPLPSNQLLIAVGGREDEKRVSSQLEALFSDRYCLIINQDTHPSVANFTNEIQQNKAVGRIFPVVFFLIAALTMLTTMTRMTSNQRTQIGVLKALGFSRRQIQFHYIAYGLWLGLLGGLIGLLIGPLFIPPILFIMQKSIYTLPHWRAVVAPSSYGAVFIAVLCCGISSYLACRRLLKEVPAATLRPAVPKAGRHSRLEKSRLWPHFGFAVQWNLRDVRRSGVRSSMAVIGVMGCTALLLFGLGLQDTVNGVSKTIYGELYQNEYKINLRAEITEEELAALSDRYQGQWMQEAKIELKAGVQKESGFMTVLDQGDAVKFRDHRRQEITLPKDGIGLSRKMAQRLKVNRGAPLQWRIYGEKEWREAKVTTVFWMPMGQGIAMGKAEYQRSGRTFRPTAYLTSEQATEAHHWAGVTSVQNREQMAGAFNEMLESLRLITAILVLAAVVLGSVVLYNLGALSFVERTRELATLKVLGFLPKQLRSLLQMQNVWLTVIGIGLGIPVGYLLTDFLLWTMPDSVDLLTNISLISIVVGITGTFAVSVLINLLLSRKVTGIDMITSLKAVE